MARTKDLLVRALALYLVLVPLFGVGAQAQRGPAAGRAQPPVDAAPPIDPPPPTPRDGVRFVPTNAPMTVRSLNGFNTDARSGYFRHQQHSHHGGVVTFASPWGEKLETRFWLTPHGVSFEYDEDLVVRYRFDGNGRLREIEAESPYRQARMQVGDRASTAHSGAGDLSDLDLSAYEVIEEALRANHSEAFLAGIREMQGVLQASCATSVIECVACIIGWAATVPALASACIVAGVPTFGAACVAAILLHEASTYACAATCVKMVEDCRGRPRGQVYPDGCEPRN